ncbi:3,5-bisphosphate nucleotidase HAL2 [Fomitiporia mediterranea MF3/22]|uniref:3,5-bisphosphate nucleotidase HAL2 n=1 Tax=Fomitiporia mediterranea (strain MF3/22) TaxID=694068 RepID=UPI0004408E2B|nr:3,5-bisphosphate nucleotidase HAL2 [Fomitiporia mediterranea MF3/22]EJD04851.1 3,5-bisphosphate nucleotidase HAL2 [Fomitiporia mediterranea MF3/22]
MSLAYALEKEVAVAAVRRACQLTSSVFNKLVKGEQLIKDDKSPVTVADFSAQAVVNTILSNAFPGDNIIGEEDSGDLRLDTNSELCHRVVQLANEALTSELALGDNVQWGIGPGSERTSGQLLDAIDRGRHPGGRLGRMWTLDPIDGTKGFIRGEQYAVCLAFLVNSVVEVGVIGCPNLPADISKPDERKGCLFIAVRGQGAEQRSLNNAQPNPLKVPTFKDSDINILESVEPSHSGLGFNERVAKILNISRPPTRLDSQAKYCALARGDGAIYLRMPAKPDYKEKIWDHAAGSLLVEEAGGIVSDSRGKPLDFGLGRTLGENYGILATGKALHGRVMDAIRQAKEEEADFVGTGESQV